MFFHHKKEKVQEVKSYDREKLKPVLKCSICNGEQVAGFQDKKTYHFDDIMFITCEQDLQSFKDMYGITGEIEKIY